MTEEKCEQQTIMPKLRDESEILQIMAKRVWFLVQGATFLVHGDDQEFPPLLLKEDGYSENRRDRAWISMAQMPPDNDMPMHATRRTGVGVRMELCIGTIDELVEKYRQELTKRVRTVLEHAVSPIPIDTPAISVLQAAQLGYKPGEAIYRDFIDPLDPLMIEYRRRVVRHDAAVVKAQEEANKVTCGVGETHG